MHTRMHMQRVCFALLLLLLPPLLLLGAVRLRR